MDNFRLLTNSILEDVPFSEEEKNKLLLIQKSIWIIKMTSVQPLFIIYRNCINKGIFPDNWKRQMLFQFTKNINK